MIGHDFTGNIQKWVSSNNSPICVSPILTFINGNPKCNAISIMPSCIVSRKKLFVPQSRKYEYNLYRIKIPKFQESRFLVFTEDSSVSQLICDDNENFNFNDKIWLKAELKVVAFSYKSIFGTIIDFSCLIAWAKAFTSVISCYRTYLWVKYIENNLAKLIDLS